MALRPGIVLVRCAASQPVDVTASQPIDWTLRAARYGYGHPQLLLVELAALAAIVGGQPRVRARIQRRPGRPGAPR